MLPAISAAGSDAVVGDTKIFGVWMLLLWVQNQDRLAEIFQFQVLVFVVVVAAKFLFSYVLLLGSGSWKRLQRNLKMAYFFHLEFPDLFSLSCCLPSIVVFA